MSRRKSIVFFIATAALAAGGSVAQNLITASVVASGGGRSQSPNACYALQATLGEPAGGRSAGGAFAIDAGFQAGIANRREPLFRNGFEECN